MKKWAIVIIIFFIVSVTMLLAHLPHAKEWSLLVKELRALSGMASPVWKPIYMHGTDTLIGNYYYTDNSHPVKYIYMGRVNTCRAGGCSSIVTSPTTSNNYESFNYFILFDSTAQVLAVRITEYNASHGHEITVRGWLKQFIGYNGNRELFVGKDIDGIAGATISVYGITNDVTIRTWTLKEHINHVINHTMLDSLEH